jgi:F-type H+-transporting ATPase subunit gamma
MASIKDIKKRIGTVKNTQQTTRAMKMVSAAKLRRAQEAIQNQRPYAKSMGGLIRKLSSDEAIGSHPLVASANSSGSAEEMIKGEVKKTVLVLITSDRGLCGGFNSSVIKAATKWMNASANKTRLIEMAFVGRRGHDFFKNRKANVGGYYPEAGGKVTFQKAKGLATSLVERFQKGDVDEIKIIYNEFKNAAVQEIVVEDFLPLKSAELVRGDPNVNPEGGTGGMSSSNSPIILIKPGAKEVFYELVSRNFSIQCFRILLESQAGEHGARMSAMENATKNAGEMIYSLTLQYNKQRQAGITKELLEIISGSESQKG